MGRNYPKHKYRFRRYTIKVGTKRPTALVNATFRVFITALISALEDKAKEPEWRQENKKLFYDKLREYEEHARSECKRCRDYKAHYGKGKLPHVGRGLPDGWEKVRETRRCQKYYYNRILKKRVLKKSH